MNLISVHPHNKTGEPRELLNNSKRERNTLLCALVNQEDTGYLDDRQFV